MTDKVRIAKKDLYAEVDNGAGQKIKTLVARKGDEISPAQAHLVDDSDTTSEQPKTRSLLAGRGRSARVQAAAEPEQSPPADAEKAKAPAKNKARKSAKNKARKSAKSK